MARDNIATVQRAVDAFLRRDMSGLLEVLDEDIELIPSKAVLEGGAYHGHEGVRRFMKDVAEDWDRFEPHADELTSVGADRVLVRGRLIVRGKASGMDAEASAAWLCNVHEGKVSRMRFCPDDEAIRDAIAQGDAAPGDVADSATESTRQASDYPTGARG